jgi:hypothetical protein
MRLLRDKREERIYAARIISKLYCSKYDKGKSAFYRPSDGGVKNIYFIFSWWKRKALLFGSY